MHKANDNPFDPSQYKVVVNSEGKTTEPDTDAGHREIVEAIYPLILTTAQGLYREHILTESGPVIMQGLLVDSRDPGNADKMVILDVSFRVLPFRGSEMQTFLDAQQ